MGNALFFFNDPATPEIHTLSLHDALPICPRPSRARRIDNQKTGKMAAGAEIDQAKVACPSVEAYRPT